MPELLTLEDRHASDAATECAMPSGRRSGRRRALVILAVLALMAVSAVAHLGALRRDLPLQDTDEEFFVLPALDMASKGDLNPDWFGHPGSTVIYPMALSYHVWDVIAHGGPLFSSNPEVQDRYDRDPTPFYLMGRLWTIALAVAAVPMLFVLGRRVFNTPVGLIGAAIWAVLPLPIHFGRMVRTESAAVFFGLLALWCCVRAWQERRARWWAIAGVSVGVAISTRYFMVALIPCLLAAVALPHRHNLRLAAKASILALACTVGGFAFTTPYFFLDVADASYSLRGEASAPHPSADGLSQIGNARWYLATAIPDALTWTIYLLALAGIALVLVRRRPRELLLLLFCPVFLVGLSLSRFHWQRWTIQLLPLLVLFAALAMWEGSRAITTRTPRGLHVGLVALVAVTALVAIGPVVDLVDMNRSDSATTTRRHARDWIRENVPRGSRVVHAPKLFRVRDTNIAPIGNGIEADYDLDPHGRTLASYRDAGYDYVVTAADAPARFLGQSGRYPAEASFYRDLACGTRLVAKFEHGAPVVGFHVYRLDQAPVRLLDYLCRQPGPNLSAVPASAASRADR